MHGPLPVESVRKFARRARTYRMLFAEFPTPESAEKLVQQVLKFAAQVVWLRPTLGVFAVAFFEFYQS